MAYSIDLAKLVTDQLTRFVTLNPHQLAGHVENLDFWLAQVRHALDGIDGYGVRFVRMDSAQRQHVSAHAVTPSEYFAEEVTVHRPSPPRRVPDHELRKARRSLTDAAARFLDRCRHAGLMSDSQWSAARDRLGLV